MKKISILAIAPYAGMAEMLNEIARSRNDIHLTIRQGNLQEGLDIAHSLLQHNNYDAVISRGGTAELLRESLDSIVVEIPLSVYDVLRCIKMAQNYGGNFAIAGFSGITGSARILCDLLQIETKIVTFQCEEDVLPVLQEIKTEGWSLVVCDQIGKMTAQTIGLNSIFIPSGKESINQAIESAISLVRTNSQIIRQKEIYKAALAAQQDACMIFNKEGELLLSTVKSSSVESKIQDIYRTGFLNSGESSYREIVHKINGKQYSICFHPFSADNETYTLLRVIQKKRLFNEKDRTVHVYGSIEEVAQTESAIGNNSANLIGNVHTIIERYSSTTFPIVIAGESGTGKTKTAELIYAGSPLRTHPYYTINCRFMTEEKWNILMNDEASPLGEVNVTINFMDLQLINDVQLAQLYEYIKDSALLKRSRIIFSILLPDERAERIQGELVNQYSCLLLRLQPLRERKTDIPSISTIYLNRLNESLGKQIIGFQQPAMELMQEYNWPQNLNQFHRVIKELVTITDGSYITETSVRTILDQENPPAPPHVRQGSGGSAIDLTRPLSQIETDIVHCVLEEEHMNKEATARRLGISRTTLWRMLRQAENK